jgi:tRNA1(Val) A37 N6-methylase TrmN6
MKSHGFLGDRLRIAQPDHGHRVGTDAILLGAMVDAALDGRVYDAGAGVGAAGLCVAARCSKAKITLIEIDPDITQFAEINRNTNKLTDRCEVLTADLLAPFADRKARGLCQGNAVAVITNPPFFDAATIRPTESATKARAHIMPEGGLGRWIAACRDMLQAHGVLHLIHRPDALPALLEALGPPFGAVTLKPVLSHADGPAMRILISAVKESRAPLKILKSLVLHQADGRFTDEAEAIHRGEAGIAVA